MEIDSQSGLTLEELRVSELLVEAWNTWVYLLGRNAEGIEYVRFRDGIHMAQQVLADRALHRAYPNYWRNNAPREEPVRTEV